MIGGVKNEINKKLRGNNDGKNKLFKELYNEKPPCQKWTNLRNSPVHDIERASILQNEIKYINLITDSESTYFISNLKQDLIEFCNASKNIICK